VPVKNERCYELTRLIDRFIIPLGNRQKVCQNYCATNHLKMYCPELGGDSKIHADDLCEGQAGGEWAAVGVPCPAAGQRVWPMARKIRKNS
jgi:hypothetical protein